MKMKQLFANGQVFCTRQEAAQALNRSVMTIQRMERDGRLTVERLTGKKQSMVSLRVDEILAILKLPREDILVPDIEPKQRKPRVKKPRAVTAEQAAA